MTELFYDSYDGEMLFDITDLTENNNEYTFTLKSEYQGQTVGFMLTVPVIVRKSLFKTVKFLSPSGTVKLESIGQESDRFVSVLEQLYKPPFKSSGKFSDAVETLDYCVLNRELYILDTDKVYIKLFNGEDQSDFDEDEKINIELNFSFNLSSKRATLAEVKDGCSSDFVAVVMK